MNEVKSVVLQRGIMRLSHGCSWEQNDGGGSFIVVRLDENDEQVGESADISSIYDSPYFVLSKAAKYLGFEFEWGETPCGFCGHYDKRDDCDAWCDSCSKERCWCNDCMFKPGLRYRFEQGMNEVEVET